MKPSTAFLILLLTTGFVTAQIQQGVWRTPSGNTNYHHFTRNGGGAAVYINQISGNNSHPILRLSSGTSDANSASHVRFTVENNGFLGLGTPTPMARFHLFNGDSGKNPHSFADLAVEDDGPGMINILTPSNENAYYGFADTDDDFVGGLQYNHTNDIMYFRVNNHTSDMVINKDGHVGIGTTTPGRKLDVSGEIRSLNGSDRAGIKVDEANSVSEIHWGDDANDRLRFFYNHWNGTASDKEVMTLLPNGNVGIGTATPNSELAVNGNIHAKEVKVDLIGWPDYVFATDYDLPTLEEVEKHIKEKGHLINIPSAKEVEKNGVQLGEMNKLLLEKIEELTLYTIKQQKEIEDARKVKMELEFLKGAYKQLLKRIENLENR